MQSSLIVHLLWMAVIPTVMCCKFAIALKEYPSSIIQRCAFGDNECLRALIQNIFDSHSHGLPEIGLLPLSPYYLKRIGISSGGGAAQSPVSMNISMTDIMVYGWDKLVVRRVVGFGKNPRKTKFRVDVYTPRETLNGQYSLSGRIMLFPLSGSGPANMTFDDVSMNITLRTEVIERNGEDYLHVTETRAVVGASHMSVDFGNLMGNAELSVGMNRVMNENQHLLVEELRGPLGRAFQQPLVELLGPVFAAYPYRQLFL